MSRSLIVLLVLGLPLMLMSCASQRVALSPLTEIERQGLGTIGIVAEESRLETSYSRASSIIDDGLRAMQDRLTDAGQGAVKQVKIVVNEVKELKEIRCRNQGCLLQVPFFLAVMVVQGAGGGIVGAINRETYSNPPLMELPGSAAIQAVQETIDSVGLPARLRDQVWERAQMYRAHHFEGLSELPADPPKTQGEDRDREIGARYWRLRDQGIQTLLKVRIPLIEFRGSDPEGSFRLFVHVETTLLSTIDQSCIRHQTWEYQGENHPIAEWSKDDAKLLLDEFDRGFPLIAQRVTQAFFEQPSLFSFGASTQVTPKSESLTCRG
ncbi:MAG TPA: hypothetical protein PLO50_15155 [Nitrospira sp.]|nr:hypothetical protein [Nitrospira sp.]